MNERIRHLEAAEAYLTGAGDPNGIVNAAEGTAYWDNVGDLLYYNTDGVTAWQVIGGGAPGAPHNLLSATHTDSTPQAVSRGSLVYGDATPTWNELVHPGTMYHLQTDATDVVWAQNITMANAAWIGNSAATSRLHFDSSGATDYAYFLGANVGVNTATPGDCIDVINTDTINGVQINSGNNALWSPTLTFVLPALYSATIGLVAAAGSFLTTSVQGDFVINSSALGHGLFFGTTNAANNYSRLFIDDDGRSLLFYNASNSGGASPTYRWEVWEDTATTNAVTYAKRTRTLLTAGSAAAGFGTGELHTLDDDGGTLRNASAVATLWTSAAAGTYTSARTWSLVNNAGALTEYIRLTPTGLGVGVTVPAARTHIDQSSAVGAIPVLTLDQGDVSEQHIVLSMSGADVDFPNILQLAVTGSPALWWDESENSFGLKNISGLLLEDADIIGNSTTTARLGFNSSGATDYAYFSGCYVGIGTTTPADWLHISDTSADSTPGIRINNDANAWRFQVNATYADGITIRDQTNATIPFTIESSAPTNAIYVKATGRVGIAANAPAGQMTIDQGSTTAAIPVLELDQADVSEGFINFIGSDRGAISGATNSVASVRAEYNGTVYRIALYADA